MAELADAWDLKSHAALRRTGSIPVTGTTSEEADSIPLPPCGESCISVGSFFLLQIEPTLLGFDLFFLAGGGTFSPLFVDLSMQIAQRVG